MCFCPHKCKRSVRPHSQIHQKTCGTISTPETRCSPPSTPKSGTTVVGTIPGCGGVGPVTMQSRTPRAEHTHSSDVAAGFGTLSCIILFIATVYIHIIRCCHYGYVNCPISSSEPPQLLSGFKHSP